MSAIALAAAVTCGRNESGPSAHLVDSVLRE
jgi:hypothetical protein